MSTFNDIDIECPSCGEEYRGTVWVAVHAGVDPKLKELLMGGELNLVSCPGCGEVVFQEHFLIYQEPDAELVAYVYPESQKDQAEGLQKAMLLGYKEAQNALPDQQRLKYDPVLFFGLESLIELLQREETLAEQSQVAEAYCKENKLDYILLHPAQARQLGIGRVLPGVSKGKPPTRTDVLAGIEKLLSIDPVLDLYAQLKETIQKDPSWALPK